MHVQLDWQVANDDGEWEALATFGRRKAALGRWTWIVLAVTLLVSGTGAGLVAQRYRSALRHIAFQIQSVIDLERQALDRGALDLFMAQQDTVSRHWYTQQDAYVRTHCARPDLGALGAPPLLTGDDRYEQCAPVAPARVRRVELKGDVAWVEVATGEGRNRQVRFYRQTELGWLHTAPRSTFWQEEAQLIRGNVIVRGHRRDLPYIEPLADHISTVADEVCAMLPCPADRALEVTFAPAQLGPQISREGLTLPSPWLSGIPDDGSWERTYLDELTYWVTQQVALEKMRANLARDLQRIEQALLAGHDRPQGRDVLPASRRSLNQIYDAAQFVARRLSPHSTALAVDHVEAVLEVEREAERIGDEAASFLLEEYAALNGSAAHAR